MPVTTMSIYKTLGGMAILLPLFAAYDNTLVHASDFDVLKGIVIDNRIDRLEESIENLESVIARLESKPTLAPHERETLIRAKNRRAKYLRKLDL